MNIKKLRYTDEQKDKINAIVNAGVKQKKDWAAIATDVNAAKIVSRSFDSRSMFKTTWAWKTSAKKAAKKTSKGKTVAKLTVAKSKKRPYNRRPQVHKIEIPEATPTPANDSVVVMVVRASNIRSVLEQLQ